MWPFSRGKAREEPDRITQIGEQNVVRNDEGLIACPRCGEDEHIRILDRSGTYKLHRRLACDQCGFAAPIADGLRIKKDTND